MNNYPRFKMTKLILLISFVSTSFFTMLYNSNNSNNITGNENTNVSAIINQEKGLYLFVESKPNFEYVELGNVKAGLTFSGQYNELKNEIIKKTLKNYPGANALIFNTEKDCSQAIAIKFK